MGDGARMRTPYEACAATIAAGLAQCAAVLRNPHGLVLKAFWEREMTILVMGTIKLGDGEGANAAKLMADHAAVVKTEDGCEEYSFAFDSADPDLVRVAERWASPEALAAHGQADHQKAFGRALRAHSPSAMSIDAWDGQHWRKLI